MNKDYIVNATEAILFASGESVSRDKITSTLEITEQELDSAVEEISAKYNSSSGILLLKLADSLQFCSNSIYIKEVREVMSLKRNTPLSTPAMEVLALVAYNEPVTKAFIEQVRGVDCSGVIGSLTLKELIEEKGRLELPGRPLIYGVTDNFLRCFGIENLSDLPPIPVSAENQGQAEQEPEEKEEIVQMELE